MASVRVWTDGHVVRLWLEGTLYKLATGRLSVEGHPGQPPGALASSPDEVVAWTPSSGKRLDEALGLRGTVLLDAVALDEARLAAVLQQGRKAPSLVVGPPEGPFEVNLPLKAKADPIDWPGGLVWDAPPSFPKGQVFAGSGPRGIRLHASDHGVGIAAAASGHVAVLRPGETSFGSVLRLPGGPGLHLDAVPTADGLLVTVLAEGRHAAVVHIGEDGAVLGFWPPRLAEGSFPALAVTGGRVLVCDRRTDALVLLALPGLEERQRVELLTPVVDAASSADGRRFVLADGSTVQTGTVVGDRAVLDDPHEILHHPGPDAPGLKAWAYRPARAPGPPRIVFPSIKRLSPPWGAGTGEPFVLELLVCSGGEGGEGVRVELSGPAVTQGLFEALEVRSSGVGAPFERVGDLLRAVLTGVPLPEGVALPLDPVPKGDEEKAAAEEHLAVTHIELAVRCRALASGSGLLTVAVDAPESAAPPLKWTRPLSVS